MRAGTFQEMLEAGTGFMANPTEALRELAKRGYTENLALRFDHLEFGGRRIFPDEFEVDGIIRFENTSDPDDQSILYAISFDGRKGTFLESYGLYHEEMSEKMIARLMHREQRCPVSRSEDNWAPDGGGSDASREDDSPGAKRSA